MPFAQTGKSGPLELKKFPRQKTRLKIPCPPAGDDTEPRIVPAGRRLTPSLRADLAETENDPWLGAAGPHPERLS